VAVLADGCECECGALVAAADAMLWRFPEAVPVPPVLLIASHGGLFSEEFEASGLVYATPNNVAAVSFVLAS
jgi:hypothetical protein